MEENRKIEKFKALVVDDVALNRELVSEMLGDDFFCYEAADGIEAIEMIEAHEEELALIMLDLMMPRKGGIEVLEYLQEKGIGTNIPVFIITGERSVEIEQHCIELGAYDFVRKPFTPSLVRQASKNAVILYQYQKSLARTVEEQTAALREQNERLANINSELVDFISNVVEARNLESGQHVKRVKAYTRILAEQLYADDPGCGLTPELISSIVSASAMHDVGKIMITDNVLLKPGKLTDEEFEQMKKHSIYGCEIIESAQNIWDDDYRRLCYEICRYHHEKYDGRGYPDKLKGEDIPLPAQIVSVADCFDALTSERVYKRRFSTDEAFAMLLGGECGAFSDRLMRALQESREKFEKQANA